MATIEVTCPSLEEANCPPRRGKLAVSQTNPRSNLTANIRPSAVSLLIPARQCKGAARNGGRP